MIRKLVLLFLLLLIGCHNNPEICILSDYGYSSVKPYLTTGTHVSFLDKYAMCGEVNKREHFIHPEWVNKSNRHNISSIEEMVNILKTYKANSISVIFFGTHGQPGQSVLNGKNILDKKDVKIIKTRLNKNGIFVFTGCSIALDFRKVSAFAKRIGHSVIAATSNTDNDPEVSLWMKGVWVQFNP